MGSRLTSVVLGVESLWEIPNRVLQSGRFLVLYRALVSIAGLPPVLFPKVFPSSLRHSGFAFLPTDKVQFMSWSSFMQPDFRSARSHWSSPRSFHESSPRFSAPSGLVQSLTG